MLGKPTGGPDKKGALKSLEKFVRVIPLDKETWKVDIYIPLMDTSSEILQMLLRTAKEKISQQHSFPVGLLYYKDLMQKDIKTDAISVSAKIIKGEAEKGNPEVRSLPAVSGYGKEYENMISYLDIYPVKESGEKLKIEEVKEILKRSGIAENKIDFEVIQKAFKSMQADLVPVKNILIAQGKFPELGVEARIEFKVPFNKDSKGDLLGGRRVSEEELICRKIPLVKSKVPGYNVKGEIVSAPDPQDILIDAGREVEVINNLEFYAAKTGIPKITIKKSQDPAVKSIMNVSVEPLEVFDGTKEAVKITSEKHIEIVGGLKSGSSVITKGEVIISGNIEKDTSIVASGNINVSGEIKGGSVFSELDIVSEGEVKSARLMANGNLTVKGVVTNSELTGYEVTSKHIVGCKVNVGRRAVIDTVSADEKGFTALISAGLSSHLKEKVAENQKFINFAQSNLQRIKKIFSEQIINESTPANVSRMMIIHTKNLRARGIHRRISGEQSLALKNLISTIGPIRDLMVEKTKANKLFTEQISKEEKGNPEVTVSIGVKTPVQVEINGIRGEISAEDGAITLKEKDGIIIKEAVSTEAKDEKPPTLSEEEQK